MTLCQNPDKKKYSKLEIAMIRNSNKCHNTLSSCFIKCENSNLRAGVHQVPLSQVFRGAQAAYKMHCLVFRSAI